MTLADKAVFFRLSPEGQEALEGLVPESGSFEALVVSQDEQGVWISMVERETVEFGQPIPVMLLKWQYFLTAALILRSPEQEGRT